MTPFSLSGLITAVAALLISVPVLLHDPRRPLNRLYAFFNLSVSWWGIGAYIIGHPLSHDDALRAWRITGIGISLIPVFFYHVVYLLCGLKKKKKLLTVYSFAVISTFLYVFSDLLVSDVRYLFGSFYYKVGGPLYPLFFIYWIGIVALAHHELFLEYRISIGTRRKQIIVFLLTGLSFLSGLMNFLPVFHIDIYPWGNFLVPIYPILMAYAIFVYGLMDIKVVITKAGLLLATYVVVLGVPFLIGWSGRERLEFWFGGNWWLAPLGICTALATMGPFAYVSLRRQAEKRFQRDQHRYRRTLQLAARGMTRVRNVTRLAHLITRLVSRTVQVTHASLFLWDQVHQRYVLRSSHGSERLALESRYNLAATHPLAAWLFSHQQVLAEETLLRYPDPDVSQELTALEAAVVVPGLLGKRLIGFLVLGPKRSGFGYAPDDLHAFATLAHEAAIALENASSYEDLLRANEQVKAASERLVLQERLAAAGQFATGMAHEIKNPLSSIKTFAEYLPEKYQDPAFREKFFRIVQSEIERINSIVQELSAFAKPAPPQLQLIHLNALLDDTLVLLSNQCLKQGVEVRNAFHQNGLTIHGDPQQLKQVLLNLFLNSLEAMPSGGRLEVSAATDHQTLRLSIADTGSGIPSEKLQQVWDPFFTTKERGMGLGLAIVKGIVERHGGQISLRSRTGQGTVVEVSLPLASPS